MYKQGNIFGYDNCSKMQDAGLLERVVKMVEQVSVRRERGGAGCPTHTGHIAPGMFASLDVCTIKSIGCLLTYGT